MTEADLEQRVLIAAPAGRDGPLLRDTLERSDVRAFACPDVPHLVRAAADGVGVIVVTEEALDDASVDQLRRLNAEQPPWSDVPIVLLVSERPAPQAAAALATVESFGNVTMLDRPVSLVEFLTAIRAALRTRRRQYEIRGYLAELKANSRAKDEFLAMLGHELRNPLSAVQNAVVTATVDDTRRPRALEIARRQLEQLGLLIDDLLDVARVTLGRIALKREHVELRALLDRTVESLRPVIDQRHHTLSVTLPAHDVRLDADAGRIEQIVTNLLTNAAKYTDPGGRIELIGERVGPDAFIRVRDSGIGIAPDVLPRVFDLFTQAERALDRADGGLGVGLTIARNLAQLHGGDIEARSAGLGRGSEFVVRLPALVCEPAAVTPDTRGVGLRSTATKTVLVVDDNADVAESLSMIIEILGHRVQAVADGAAALEKARTTKPDVMLVDIGLPGMDGYEVARRIRRDPALERIVLIALTGYGTAEDKARSSAAGFDHHLVKPVDVDALRDLVARLEPAGCEPAPTVH
jgi:signal transduction histidine kinase/ActR/RegA family two-component response regulator